MVRSHVMLVIFLSIAILFLFTSPSNSQDLEDHGKKEALIQGNILQACLVAYSDFAMVLKDRSKNPSETMQIMSKLENYNIEIYSKDDTYFIRFTLNIKKFPYIRGGPADYVIDRKTIEILKKEYWR